MDDPSPDPSAAGDAADPAPTVRPVDLRDYVDFREAAATRVRVFATQRIALDLWCLEPQQATPPLHLPDQDVTYTVIGGRSWFVTDEGEIGLDPMGSMLVPAGVVHGIDNRAPDPLIVIAATSPPGEAAEDDPVGTAGEAIRPPEGPGPVRRAVERLLGTGDRGR